MNGPSDEQLKELVTIRKLLMLGLLRSGMTQAQLAASLGVHRTMIGKMFPTGALAEMQKKPRNKSPEKSESASDQ